MATHPGCFACGKPAPKVCTRCHSARFCSAGCMAAAWPRHKAACTAIKALAPEFPPGFPAEFFEAARQAWVEPYDAGPAGRGLRASRAIPKGTRVAFTAEGGAGVEGGAGAEVPARLRAELANDPMTPDTLAELVAGSQDDFLAGYCADRGAANTTRVEAAGGAPPGGRPKRAGKLQRKLLKLGRKDRVRQARRVGGGGCRGFWLVTSAAFAAGEPILVAYGTRYWFDTLATGDLPNTTFAAAWGAFITLTGSMAPAVKAVAPFAKAAGGSDLLRACPGVLEGLGGTHVTGLADGESVVTPADWADPAATAGMSRDERADYVGVESVISVLLYADMLRGKILGDEAADQASLIGAAFVLALGRKAAESPAEAAARAEATAHVPRLVRLAMGGSEKVKAAVAHLRRRAGGA